MLFPACFLQMSLSSEVTQLLIQGEQQLCLSCLWLCIEMRGGAAPGSVSSTRSLRKPLGSRKGSSRLDTRAFRPDSSSCSSGSAAPNWSCSRFMDQQSS